MLIKTELDFTDVYAVLQIKAPFKIQQTSVFFKLTNQTEQRFWKLIVTQLVKKLLFYFSGIQMKEVTIICGKKSGKKKHANKILVGKPLWKSPYRRRRLVLEIIIKVYF